MSWGWGKVLTTVETNQEEEGDWTGSSGAGQRGATELHWGEGVIWGHVLTSRGLA